MIRIGVDLGGTKIEVIALDAAGREVLRDRVPTPQGDYHGTITCIRDLVTRIERQLGAQATVGIGTPGAVSLANGRIKNANSTWLNGGPFLADVNRALSRTVRVANDANCFALSEAVDGAGVGHRMVFGVILGTGVGGGIVLDHRRWIGGNAIAGEWGHNDLPRRTDEDLPSPACYCGRLGCIETYLSGPGLAADHLRRTSQAIDARAVAMRARSGDGEAAMTMDRFHERLAKALASVINVLDPDVIVIGGGLSQIDGIYREVPARLSRYVFSDVVTTPVVKNRHGDSSGVRGAAWLWPA
ncbi:MAG: ROK family protein [Burkholderiales bacterium]